MSQQKLFAVVVVSLALAGCRQSPWIMKPNAVPVARAQVIGPDGETLLDPVKPDAGPNVKGKPTHNAKIEYTGSDVAITLDGSHSSDDNGKIVKYRWISAAPVSDGGVRNLTRDVPIDGGTKSVPAGGRSVPVGEKPNWPDGDEKQPKIQLSLGEGVWAFSLWVIDDKGAISKPDMISITIGKPDPRNDPKVKMCVDGVAKTDPPVSDACKVCACNLDDACRMNLQADKCDATCWGLINCITTKCPNFAMMAAMMDYSCFSANCTAFMAGSTGATPAGACLRRCPADCTAMSGGSAGSSGGAGTSGSAGSSGGAAAGASGGGGMSGGSAGAAGH